MDHNKQYETMAAIRAYAAAIASERADDTRPTTAWYTYREKITRMFELQKILEATPNG